MGGRIYIMMLAQLVSFVFPGGLITCIVRNDERERWKFYFSMQVVLFQRGWNESIWFRYSRVICSGFVMQDIIVHLTRLKKNVSTSVLCNVSCGRPGGRIHDQCLPYYFILYPTLTLNCHNYYASFLIRHGGWLWYPGGLPTEANLRKRSVDCQYSGLGKFHPPLLPHAHCGSVASTSQHQNKSYPYWF